MLPLYFFKKFWYNIYIRKIKKEGMVMKWMVAPSYKYATIVKVNGAEHKAYITEKCDRCGGHGIVASRIENGHIVPIPVDGGVCYKCGGSGTVSKWVKAYTEKEYERYMKAQERAKERKKEKEEARLQALKDNSEENKKAILAKWGFDVEDPAVYLVTGNTYEIKDELKERGGRFNPALNWHFTKQVEVPEGHELVKVAFDDVYDWMPMVKRIELKENAKEVAAAARISATPASKSEWMGEVKERMRDLAVVLTGARDCSSLYGISTLYTFDCGENKLFWFTTSIPKVEMIVGHSYLLTGTVKNHNERDGVKQTQLNRCILKEVC